MTWFRVDDGFYDHPKVVALGSGRPAAQAIALWILAGSWSARHLTDGFISARTCQKLGSSLSAARQLVATGLWVEVDGGFRFHEWDQHQPLRADIIKKRRKNADKVASWRDGKRANSPPCNPVTTPVTETDVTRLVTPPPSRPVPSRREREERERGEETHTQSACVRAGDPMGESEALSLASRVQTRFRALYLAACQVEPGMGGQSVGGFPAQLEGTARARGVDPLALLEQAFAAWATQGRPGRERSTPYAAFVARFDALVDPPEAAQRGGLPQTVPALREVGKRAVIAGDMDTVRAVNARVAELEARDERGRRARG